MGRTARTVLFVVSVVVGALLVFVGVRLLDLAEVVANGTVLCLSCVGIG